MWRRLARAGHPPSGEAIALFAEGVVDGVEDPGQELVVVAEFEKLGVGVFQKLNGGFGAGGAVVEEGGVPADDGHIGGVVGDLGIENLGAFAFGEGLRVAAHDLGDLAAGGSGEVQGQRLAWGFADVEDEVILAEPAAIGLDQGGGGAVEALADDGLDAGGEIDVPDPAAGEADERVPVAGKGNFEQDADDAVVVVLDLAGEAFAGFEDQRVGGNDDGRALIANVGGGDVLEAGLLDGSAVDDLLEAVDTDLLADVELDEDADGTDEGRG